MLQPHYRIKLSQDQNWQMSQPHFHEDIEILLSLSASGNFFVGGSLYPLRAGTLFLFGDATLHRSITASDYQRYVLHVSPDTLNQLSTPDSDLLALVRGVQNCCRQLEEEQAEELGRQFRRLEQATGGGFCGGLKKSILLMQLLLTALTLFNTIEGQPGGASQDLERIRPIMDYIQGHLSEAMSLDFLAGRFFMNKYHMCRIFKTAIGFSVTEYIISCRMLKARELLRGGMRVQDVGEQVGFQNNAHFIRTFGKLTGTSPKRYAKEYLSGVKE